MNRRLIIIGFIFLIIFVGFFILQKQNPKEKEIHYHAGFQVYVDGKLQDFSAAKYMTIKPCGEDEKEREENEQIEKAHLHDGVGDVVHVEAKSAKWKDLFQNLKFKIEPNWEVEGYVSGKKVEDIFGYPINSYDSVVIFIGKTDVNLLKDAITKERIMEVEKESETC